MLLPERKYNGVWHRILHDQTAESLSREISRLPHANVTTVPFHFDDAPTCRRTPQRRTATAATATGTARRHTGAPARATIVVRSPERERHVDRRGRAGAST